LLPVDGRTNLSLSVVDRSPPPSGRERRSTVRVALGVAGRGVLGHLVLKGLKLASVGALAGLAGVAALTPDGLAPL
jgi:hypothetical protein